MKVSEKSLELNIGAELLNVMRNNWGLPKTYLRGLTQAEERQEGVDFFAQLSPNVKIMAFQFKAPKGTKDGTAYKYTLVRYQHDLLFGLAQLSPQSVFYVLPHYVTTTKLQADVPDLLQDTWLLSIDQMPTQPVFGGAATKVVRCEAGQAKINPEYKLLSVGLLTEGPFSGIPAHDFARWYERHVHRGDREMRRNPWLVRGLRVSIVAPQ